MNVGGHRGIRLSIREATDKLMTRHPAWSRADRAQDSYPASVDGDEHVFARLDPAQEPPGVIPQFPRCDFTHVHIVAHMRRCDEMVRPITH
jgi:hypothetical protein